MCESVDVGVANTAWIWPPRMSVTDGAELVLHDDRLPERFAHRLREHARHEIGRAADREVDHQADRLGRVLRACLECKEQKREEQDLLHGVSLIPEFTVSAQGDITS